MLPPQNEGERAAFLRELAYQTVPSFDFFLFSLLSGLVLGVALLVDAPALFVLAALLAPFMAPALGISLGTVTGAMRFTLQSLGSLGIGSLIVFLCGAVAGWAANLLPARAYQQAAFHSHFTWPDFAVLLVGAALTTLLLVRAPHQKPLVSSVALAYGLYLPVGAAGFGMSSGISGLWPDGLGLFLIHLIWAVVAGIIVLALLGLRPSAAPGYLASAVYAVVGLVALGLVLLHPQAALPGIFFPRPAGISAGSVTRQPDSTASPTPLLTASTALTRSNPTPSKTPTRTLVPTRTPTITYTPVPTPVWARINASQGDGALIREKPNYNATVVSSALNGTLVEVLPDVIDSEGVAWVHIRLTNGKEGWVVRGLLRTATPAPNW